VREGCRTLTPRDFVEAVKGLNLENTFNPYLHLCAVHDHKDAPRRRANMLCTILEAATQSEIDSLWIGRDLGYRGGRRTGLALTDDPHIELMLNAGMCQSKNLRLESKLRNVLHP